MNQSPVARFFRYALVGAVMYLLPITVVVVLFGKVLKGARAIARPVAERIPVESVAGVGVLTALAVFLIVFGCFLAGYFSKRTGKWRQIQKLEDSFLCYIPGYILLQSWAAGMAGVASDRSATVVLANIEEAWQPAYLIETLEDGNHAVLVPGAPSPFSGSIFYLPENRIKRLNVPFGKVARVVRRFGAGSREMLKGEKLEYEK